MAKVQPFFGEVPFNLGTTVAYYTYLHGQDGIVCDGQIL